MKNFLTIWVGELISNIGSGMTAFALAIYVYQMTGSVAYVSIVPLLAFMPKVLLSPIGGILADRYDRRLLMICGDILSGLGLLYILVNIKSGNQGILPILIGVCINSVFVALMEPAYRATVSDLLTEDQYAKASGMVQMSGNAEYLISPAIAGVLLSISDISLILYLDIATFVITVIAVAIARKHIQKPTKQEVRKGIKKEFCEGIQAITETKGVQSLIILMTLMCFFIGFIQTLTAPMILILSNAKTVGFIESICAIGMLIGSVFIGIFGIRKHQYSRVLFIASVLCGVFMSFVGLRTNLLFISAALFLFFLTIPFINSCAEVILRLNIPNELQGRLWGIVGLLTQTGTIIAYATCGIIADVVFEPMFQESGLLAENIGKLIGTGQGRGIGFMLVLSGIGMIMGVILMGKTIWSIEVNDSN